MKASDLKVQQRFLFMPAADRTLHDYPPARTDDAEQEAVVMPVALNINQKRRMV